MRKFGLMVATGLMVWCTGAAADPAQTTTDTAPVAAATAAPAEDTNKMVCRSQPAPTGTRLGARRTCRTQKEWDMIQLRDRQELERQQSNRFNSTPGLGGGG